LGGGGLVNLTGLANLTNCVRGLLKVTDPSIKAQGFLVPSYMKHRRLKKDFRSLLIRGEGGVGMHILKSKIQCFFGGTFLPLKK
jgi:hypothetical protein